MAFRHPRYRVRPQIQRSFMTWLNANQTKFAIPVRLGRRTRKHWQIRFSGVIENISAVLIANGTQNELVVAAEWQGECWDLLASFEASPYNNGVACFCALCEESHRQAFVSRQELWLDHLFTPFLDWVNMKLAPANWLVLENHDGATSAELSIEYPDQAVCRIILPLRTRS